MCHFSSIVFGFICVLYSTAHSTAQYSTAPIALCLWCLNDCLWYRVIFFVYVRFDSFQPYILIHFNAFALQTRKSWQNKHWNHLLGRNEKKKKERTLKRTSKWRLLDQYCLFSLSVCMLCCSRFLLLLIATSTLRPTNNKLLYKIMLEIIINCDIEDLEIMSDVGSTMSAKSNDKHDFQK